MIDVPPGFAPPVTNPVLDPIVATVVLLLIQVPPADASFNVVVAPVQIPVVPVIDGVTGFTDSIAVAAQPVDNVYEIVAVELPGGTPVAIPVDPMVAALVLLLLHVPDPVASFKVVVRPGHTNNVPPIAAGSGFTVSVIDFVHPKGDV
jgi:hypothetical protein